MHSTSLGFITVIWSSTRDSIVGMVRSSPFGHLILAQRLRESMAVILISCC
jgi:hypothetical protein